MKKECWIGSAILAIDGSAIGEAKVNVVLWLANNKKIPGNYRDIAKESGSSYSTVNSVMTTLIKCGLIEKYTENQVKSEKSYKVIYKGVNDDEN